MDPEQPSVPKDGGTYPAAERARPRIWRQPTPLGDVEVVTSDAGIRRLGFCAEGATIPADEERDERVARELDEYFVGERRTFSVGIDLSEHRPDHFGVRVLTTLHAQVGWGETVSYGELADMVGAPRAARAVGNVMAHSPISVVVPCHRVVAADGRLGGYGRGGLAIKRALLALEGVHLSD